MYDTATRKRVWRSTGRTSLTAAQEQVKTWEIEDARAGRVAKPPRDGLALDEWLRFKAPKLTPLALEGYTAYAEGWIENLGAGTLLRALTQGDDDRSPRAGHGASPRAPCRRAASGRGRYGRSRSCRGRSQLNRRTNAGGHVPPGSTQAHLREHGIEDLRMFHQRPYRS